MPAWKCRCGHVLRPAPGRPATLPLRDDQRGGRTRRVTASVRARKGDGAIGTAPRAGHDPISRSTGVGTRPALVCPACARGKEVGVRDGPASPAKAREVSHGDLTHLAALDHLDRAVPAGPRRVAARSIELLNHLDDIEALTACHSLDLLPLKVWRNEAIALPGADPRDPYIPDRFPGCHSRAPFCRDCRVRRGSSTRSSTSATRSRRTRPPGGSGRLGPGRRSSTPGRVVSRTTSPTATRRS